MMRFALVLTFALTSAMTLALGGCATPPPPAPKAEIGFSGAPLKMDVASARLDNRYQPPGRAPNVEQLHAVTPSTVASRWLETRVVPVGPSGEAVLTVLDARVVEEKLPVKGGLTGFFGDQLDSRFTGTLRAKLTVTRSMPNGGFSNYEAVASVKAEQTVLQSADLNERDQAYFDVTKKLTSEFDRAMSAEVARVMGAVLRR
tara:strand:+ start:74562 stop:75167 length:606 start_codon:yes stop_codon:yes gene_type:complete